MDSKKNVAMEKRAGLSHDEIAIRAYCLWEERGSAVGSPEDDWFRAEQEILREIADSAEMGKRPVGKALRASGSQS